MSVRARSWLGAVLFPVGAFLVLGGSLFPGVVFLFWVGMVLVAAASIILGWALRDVSREIGASHASFEARLRSEIGEKREQKPRP